MKFILVVFGLPGGFFGGALATSNPLIGGVGAVIGGIIMGKIGGSFGKKAVKAEADALSGEGRSVVKEW